MTTEVELRQNYRRTERAVLLIAVVLVASTATLMNASLYARLAGHGVPKIGLIHAPVFKSASIFIVIHSERPSTVITEIETGLDQK